MDSSSEGIAGWTGGFLAVRLGTGSLLRVGRERDCVGSARFARRGVEVLELRPLLLVGSGSTASAGRSSSRLAPVGAEGRLPGSPSRSRASGMVISDLTGSRGVDLDSTGFTGTDFGQNGRKEAFGASRHTGVWLTNAIGC